MLSKLILGTAQFGLNYGVANIRGQVDSGEVRDILDYARRAGINALDTAVNYGSAEEILGEIGLDGFHVVTKVPPLPLAVTLPRRWLLDHVKGSIRRLKVDKLYGLLLHHPKDLQGDRGQALVEQLQTIKSLGLVEKIGVSIYSPNELDKLDRIAPILSFDLIQAPMNVFDRRLEDSGWLARLVGKGVEIHLRSIFLQGLLTMPNERIPPRFDQWRSTLSRWHQWLHEQELSAIEACVAHMASYADVAHIIVGCDSLRQLEEIVRASARPKRTAPVEFRLDDERLINPAIWATPTKTLAIIQARLGSTRLPGKVLADVHGRPMLDWLLSRIKSVSAIDEIVVATTTNPLDDRLQQWVVENGGVECYRGNEHDVLDRFYRCAEGRGADLIVRITADDPLKDPDIISRAIGICRADNSLDYCSNAIRPSYPEGLDIEVFRFAALERAFREAKLPSEREHVTPYIWKNPGLFRVKNLEFERDLSNWRWTVDKPADLELIRIIFGHFIDRPLVPFTEVIAFIEQHPELLLINAGTIRHEGYLKSLAAGRE